MLAYAHGALRVGLTVARTADSNRSVLVPVLCLAEAYRQAPGQADLLDVFQGLGHVHVTPVEQDMAPFLGGFSNTLGRMDLANLVVTASEYAVVPIMTSERKLITQILPSEWPIIDL
ncbi:MAG: hypothetical protein ACRDT4_23150 [Micromonosporaceae bacterium]